MCHGCDVWNNATFAVILHRRAPGSIGALEQSRPCYFGTCSYLYHGVYYISCGRWERGESPSTIEEPRDAVHRRLEEPLRLVRRVEDLLGEEPRKRKVVRLRDDVGADQGLQVAVGPGPSDVERGGAQRQARRLLGPAAAPEALRAALDANRARDRVDARVSGSKSPLK